MIFFAAIGTTDYNTHTHLFNGPFSGTTRVSQYQKSETNLDFTEARYTEWQWHQLGHMRVCFSLQTDNHASTPPLKFFTGQMPFLPPYQQRQSTTDYNTCDNNNLSYVQQLVTDHHSWLCSHATWLHHWHKDAAACLTCLNIDSKRPWLQLSCDHSCATHQRSMNNILRIAEYLTSVR